MATEQPKMVRVRCVEPTETGIIEQGQHECLDGCGWEGQCVTLAGGSIDPEENCGGCNGRVEIDHE